MNIISKFSPFYPIIHKYNLQVLYITQPGLSVATTATLSRPPMISIPFDARVASCREEPTARASLPVLLWEIAV